jgi:hypothetical protein
MRVAQHAGPESGARRRRPPAVAAAILLSLLVGLVCSCSCSEDSTTELPENVAKRLKGVHVWCPHCEKAFIVGKEQAEAVAGSEPIFVKALKVPCPTCKKADGEEAIKCAHCEEFVAVAVKKGERGLMKCPGCGKYPYGEGPPSGAPMRRTEPR